MNLFKSNKFAVKAPTTIRVERVPAARSPAPLPSKVASSRSQQAQRSANIPSRASSATARSSPATPPADGQDTSRRRTQKRKAPRQRSPAQLRLESDSDDDEADEATDGAPYKRQKSSSVIDSKRQLRSRKAFSEVDGGVFDMVHAADIVSETKKSKLAAKIPVENVTVELKYPSSSQRERYDLVFGNDKIDPIKEIYKIAQIVTEVYLTEEQRGPFSGESGIMRKLQKAKNLLSSTRDVTNKGLLDGFKKAVDHYNSAIDGLVKDGILAKNLDEMHHLPFEMVECIRDQVYDRVVSPKVDILRRYTNGSDNIYGELKPRFISRALAEAGLKSDQVFVDLGSGVGNVVLQAALEFGCESWGCEMMENACNLADAQQVEFAARCRLWGIQAGEVRLERGDFLENQEIQKAMRRADVILVNNQAFTAKLNQNLTDLFLDLKDGCKIISLRSFVPDGHQISARNLSNPVNLLDVRRGEYHSQSVSWTDAGGDYFIAKKDEKRLKAFAERM